MLIIDPPEVEVGTDYEGEVVNIATFGAFINILPGKDGLLHISKFHSSKRVSDPEKVLEVGQKLLVHVQNHVANIFNVGSICTRRQHVAPTVDRLNGFSSFFFL